jgi:hypothetical protein
MNRRPPLGGGQIRHADDWLMTYADTITLLLCLFVVRWCTNDRTLWAPPRPYLNGGRGTPQRMA